MPPLSNFRASLKLLGTKQFGTFWFASLLSSIGTWAQQVAEPWLLLTLGASSFVIGLDSFAMNAPVWALTLVGGALADRSDRRRVITIFQSIQMLCPTAIIVLLVTHRTLPWMIVALSVVVGVTDALSMPSFQSIVPSIVPRAQIDRGLALNSTQFNLSRILGPSIAGVLMASFGAMACFGVSALSYIPFIAVALWILPKWTPPPPSTGAKSPARRNPFSGVGDIIKQPHLRGALLSVLVNAVLCSQLVTFSPVIVKDVFHGGAGHFSTAVAAFGAGGLLGATGLLSLPSTLDRRKLSAAFALLNAIAVVLIALNPWFWGMPPILVLAGASMTMTNTASNTLLQTTANPRLLGQTVGLYMLALRGGISIGAVITGATVTFLGVQRALLINGCIAIALQLVFATLWLRTPLPPPHSDAEPEAAATAAT